jgi:hypothetical protein
MRELILFQALSLHYSLIRNGQAIWNQKLLCQRLTFGATNRKASATHTSVYQERPGRYWPIALRFDNVSTDTSLQRQNIQDKCYHTAVLPASEQDHPLLSIPV